MQTEVEVDRYLLRPEDAAHVLSIGRSKLYELLASGRLPSVMIDGCRRVRTEDIEASSPTSTRRRRRHTARLPLMMASSPRASSTSASTSPSCSPTHRPPVGVGGRLPEEERWPSGRGGSATARPHTTSSCADQTARSTARRSTRSVTRWHGRQSSARTALGTGGSIRRPDVSRCGRTPTSGCGRGGSRRGPRRSTRASSSTSSRRSATHR
ncbi:MAG: helix-turn-helix domain-containing protein [Actinobacteria bacterium]|nr:helix-turn-helix domain-containing protein [Actinomycetota bacterium]